VLGAAMFVAAEDKDKDKDKAGGMEMTGMICNAKCVKQDAGKAACDAGCKEKGGDVVFVDDAGKSYKITKQKMAKSHEGKKVKMMGKMKGESMEPMQIVDLGLGGG
jgi:hypothetical protein